MGVKGWLNITKQIFVFLIVICLPLLLFFFLQRLSSALDVWRRQLISRSSMNYRFRTSVALWLNRLNPYMPWAIMLLAAEASKGLLDLVGLIELGIFIPYLELYILYRIFRKALTHILGVVLVGGNLETLKLKNDQVQGTARRIGLLLFIELALLHATEDAVRKVLVYSFISSSIWYFNFLFFIFEFNKWRDEILVLSDSNLNKQLMGYLAKVKKSKWLIIVLPVLLILNLLFLGGLNLFKWLIRYDFFKQITSEIYKKRLQERVEGARNIEVSVQPIPETYLKYFALAKPPDENVYVTRARESYIEVLEGINTWINNRSEVDAIVVYGDKGIGKTSLLTKVQNEIKAARALYLDVPGRISSPEELYKVIGGLLGFEFEPQRISRVRSNSAKNSGFLNERSKCIFGPATRP